MPVLPCPLLERLWTALERSPQAVAISGLDSVLTYRELWEYAISWRDRLLALTPAPHSSVAVLSNGSSGLVPAFLGVRAAGLVPLLVDGMMPSTRRADMIRASRAAIILNPASRSATVNEICDPGILPAEAGYLAFSSGTQGPPKGIIGNAAGLAAFLDWEQELLGLGSTIRGALLTSPSFDVVLRDMLLPLLAGGVLCVPGPGVRTDPSSVIPWLRANDVNVVHLVPSLSTRWVAASESMSLPGLRWSLFAGEPLYARHVQLWRSTAPSTRVVNLYGPTETTLAKYWHVVEEPTPAGLQPVGRGLPGTRLVADPGKLGPDNGSFRITLETPDGSLGYLPDGIDAAESQALTRRDGITRFVSQDRGRLGADGLLTVEGRLDGLVKRHGVMVDLADVTAQALANPGVEQACCLQIDLDAAGSIVLAIEVTAGFSMRHFTGNLRRTLGPAMPNDIVCFNPLPMLPNGKTDRQAVRYALNQKARKL
jgi:D-alanine--poly(phosphoribitol) ligase subunit 1